MAQGCRLGEATDWRGRKLSEGSFALKVQLLPTAADRVLVLGHVLGLANEGRRFTTAEIGRLFEKLHLPGPSNPSQSLGHLRSRQLVISHGTSRQWSLTPLGEKRVLQIVGELDTAKLQTELAQHPGAVFADARHSVIAPEFAPPRWNAGIARLLERFPFESNVFCMTRFPSSDDDSTFLDPVKEVVATLRAVLDQHGMTLHLASDRQIDDELLGNVAAYMWACRFGIGLLENRARRGLNYNVVIELGSMLMTGRRCAMLKDQTAPFLPSDLAGQIYKPLDFGDLASVSAAAHNWLAEDLGLGRCRDCARQQSRPALA